MSSLRFFFFSSRRRHTRFDCDWSSDVCSSDLPMARHQHVRPILLVEDDPDLRDAVRLVLEDAGYDVVCAGEGREALTRVRESPFSLVLLDLMLPVMDGFEFRVQQMQDPEIASIPVIVFSCGNDLEEKVA